MSGQREWYEKDYYAVLGVSKDASVKDITKAYRRLARQYHPDANPDNAVAEEKFKDISAAYDVVGDEKTCRVRRSASHWPNGRIRRRTWRAKHSLRHGWRRFR